MTHAELRNRLVELGCDADEILRDVNPGDQATIDALSFLSDRVVTGIEIL